MPHDTARAPARTTLFVRALRVDARVGIYSVELETPQLLLVDLEIDIEAPENDNIEATLDYVGAADIVCRNAESCEFQLIETLARTVGEEFLSFGCVRKILVRITKPSALANRAGATGVELVLKARPRSKRSGSALQ